MPTSIPKPKLISPYRLSSLIRLQKDPKLALQLFLNPNPNDAQTLTLPSKPFKHSLLSYDLIITKLGRAKMFNQMELILDKLKNQTNLSPPEPFFCQVISSYSRARLADKAVDTFLSIPSFRCPRTHKSFNSLLAAMFTCREFEKFNELVENLDKYVKPNVCTYNIIIRACMVSGGVDDAWEVFDEMRERVVSPNGITFGTLVSGLCMNHRLEEAFNLKDDMVRVYGVRPDVGVYTALIKGVCCNDGVSLGFKLKEEMEREGIELDSAVYTTLIDALFKSGRKDEVNKCLEEMRERGCKMNTAGFNAMIRGFCMDKDFDAAYRILDEMAENGCRADVICHNVILSALCKEGKVSEANDLLEDMPRRGCTPDVVSYQILFDNLCEKMHNEAVALFLDEMVFKGFAPRLASVSKFVGQLCEEGNLDLLLTVLKSLGKGNIVGTDSWTKVVSMAFKEDKLSSVDLVNRLIAA